MSLNNDTTQRVVPAQLDFLTIYNPTLSSSDETLKDQIVYYYSRRNRKTDTVAKKTACDDAEDEADRRLRQIGLAQGMVSFARNFSESNVDAIETDKSRIVLHELEKDWWVLASVDLTRLPSRTGSTNSKNGSAYEYSAREVTPAPLLVTQLVRAHTLFLLHHAVRLQDLFDRVGRDLFCSLLDRYWNKFVRNWDVLLHGNPAATIFNATKLSGGGELGIGVGEEEWGSGEREVLEDFIDRTTGLKELVVGRYGNPPQSERRDSGTDWLGTGMDVSATDGVVFSGKGLISKRSLRTVSQWMEAIFKYGDQTYGVGDNPSARPRPKRKHRSNGRTRSSEDVTGNQEPHPKSPSVMTKPSDLRRKAMENNATPPGIPAPLVAAAEKSLDDALSKASARKSGESSHSRSSHTTASEMSKDDNSAFGSENVMKYLTLGYGSSWTLNPKGLKGSSSKDDTSQEQEPSDPENRNGSSSGDTGLQEVDPTPEVSEDEAPFRQRLEQTTGRFLIGLSGDLDQTELESEGDDESLGLATGPSQSMHRLFLRTLNVEMATPKQQERNPTIRQNSSESFGSTRSGASKGSRDSRKSNTFVEPPTSASASIDGARPHVTQAKVQVAVYVRQPFIFVFLFDLHTPSLTIPSFYRSIHNQLGPLQKPLLRSTDPSRIAARIAEGMGEKSSSQPSTHEHVDSPIHDLTFDPGKLTVRTSIPNIPIPGSLAAEGLSSSSPGSVSVSGSWYTLGIPVGTTSSHESPAKLVQSSWSRTEALNVHSQILNTYAATRSGRDLENTVKTARGWWVVWMTVLLASESQIKKQKNNKPNTIERPVSSSTINPSSHKEAFLVRKAIDSQRPPSTRTKSGPGLWLLREQRRDTSSTGSTRGTPAKGVSDGVGVDAKRYIEGLFSLTQ